MHRFVANELTLLNQDPVDGRVVLEFKNASGAEAGILLAPGIVVALKEAFRVMALPPAKAGQRSEDFPQTVSITSLIEVTAGEGLLGLLVRQSESASPVLIRLPEPVFARVLQEMAKLGELALHKGTRQ